jgi:hypothetical protein
MATLTLVKLGRSFPKAMAPRRRGMGQSISELEAEAAYLPSFPSSLLQNLATGTLSPAQIALIKARAQADNAVAATDPNTGLVNDAVLTQANANLDSAIAAGANVSNQSTGSVIADLIDTAQGTGPGFLASLGIGSGPSGSTNWNSILQTLLIVGAVGLGGYFIVKKL